VYLGLLDRLGEQLGLEDELEDYWQANSDRGPLLRWMGALREVVLARLSAPIVIFIDEIDAVRSLPFSPMSSSPPSANATIVAPMRRHSAA